jgi:hypothetical protein
MSLRDRTKVLDQFRAGGPTHPRVLLMSTVGTVGLNMAFANVMIIAVSLSFSLSPTRDILLSAHRTSSGPYLKTSN